MIRQNSFRKVATAILVVALMLTGGAFAQVDTGQADFSRYVALGDSLTAGFISGSLHQDSQVRSYPALIHQQATGFAGGFEQPLVSEPGIPGILRLQSLAPLIISPTPGLGNPLNLLLPRPYDNLAVPGTDVHDSVATVTDNGGLHDLILRGLGTQAQQAFALSPTFVTLWIGNNDALGAATSGIVLDGITLTKTADFQRDFLTLVGTLQAAGVQQWAAATIPSVTSIPFVTTIPPVLLDPATNQPVIINGQLVPLIGPRGPLGPGDFVLLTATTQLAQGIGIPAALGGTGKPLPDSAVLDAGEAARIEARVAEFNDIIRQVATDSGAAIVPVDSIFEDIVANGLNVGGIQFATDFLTGGMFSYDGVHASSFGYAVIANEFVKAVNQTYGGNIPQVDLFTAAFTPSGGTGAGAPTAVTASTNFIFTRRADKNLRWALGVPSKKRLRKLKRGLQSAGGGVMAPPVSDATTGRDVGAPKVPEVDAQAPRGLEQPNRRELTRERFDRLPL